MIETKFIKDVVKEFQISEFISESLSNVGFSHSEVQKTPLGEKILIYASRPGLVVGRKGENIQKLTKTLKSKFKMENPQIEIIEVEKPMLDAKIVAERIASSLERFGASKFKGIGHKTLADVIDAGAQGIEILISGKIPSSRAKTWRFYQGYLKKSGDVAMSGIRRAYAQARLKTGIVGIQVRITPPELILPDKIINKEMVVESEDITSEDTNDKTKKSKKKNPVKKQKKQTKKQDKKQDKKQAKSNKSEAKDNTAETEKSSGITSESSGDKSEKQDNSVSEEKTSEDTAAKKTNTKESENSEVKKE